MDYREYGILVWNSEKLQIYKSEENKTYCRLYLVDKKDGTLLNELIAGYRGLKKYYKGDFKTWAIKMIDKNLKARQKEAAYFQDQLENQEYLITYYFKIRKTL